MPKFEPGQSGNPKGRPPRPNWLKSVLKKYKGDYLIGLIGVKLDMSVKALTDELEDDHETCASRMIARLVYRGVVEGDPKFLNLILDRMVGKAKEHKEIKMVEPFIVEGLNGRKIELGNKEKDEENG